MAKYRIQQVVAAIAIIIAAGTAQAGYVPTEQEFCKSMADFWVTAESNYQAGVTRIRFQTRSLDAADKANLGFGNGKWPHNRITALMMTVIDGAYSQVVMPTLESKRWQVQRNSQAFYDECIK